jgi:hypothetical protein
MTPAAAYYRDRLAAWADPVDQRRALIEFIRLSVEFCRNDAELAAEVRAEVAAYNELVAGREAT